MKLWKDKKVLAAYLVVCVVWGSTYLAIKIGVSGFPPLLFAGTRHVAAGVLMTGYSLIRKHKFPKDFKEVLQAAIVGLFLLTAANGLVVYAEQWVDYGFVSLAVAINPILILILETIVLRRYKASPVQILGMLFGFSGVALLVGTGVDISGVPPISVIFVFLAPFFWATGSVIGGSRKIRGSIVSISGIQMLSGGIGQLIIGTIRGEISRISGITTGSLYAWIYLVLFGSIIAYSCYQYTLRKLPASIAGTSTYVNPVIGVALGAAVLNENISPGTVASTVVILTSVILIGSSKKGVSLALLKKR